MPKSIVRTIPGHEFTPAPWYLIADPGWKGKHPMHDHRFVTNFPESAVEMSGETGPDGCKPWRAPHGGLIICTLPDSENQLENGRLIAGAPDLYAQLEALADQVARAGLIVPPNVIRILRQVGGEL